jgi:hypothetical protein
MEKGIIMKKDIIPGTKLPGFRGGPEAGNHPYQKDGTWIDEKEPHPTPPKCAQPDDETTIDLGPGQPQGSLT